MLIPCNIDVVTRPIDTQWLYAIYMHMNADDVVHYVGMTLLSKLFTFEDAACNSEWAKRFHPSEALIVKVTHLTTDEREAVIEQRRLIAHHQPHCNIRGYYMAAKYHHVECIETGERWRSAADAARSHGLTYSALHAHLKGKPGHKTVKDRTYRYTPPW